MVPEEKCLDLLVTHLTYDRLPCRPNANLYDVQ